MPVWKTVDMTEEDYAKKKEEYVRRYEAERAKRNAYQKRYREKCKGNNLRKESVERKQ